MLISIIIPTYNRNKILCKTLSNIVSFKHQYNELIVVDQSKTHEPDTKLFLYDLVQNKKIKYINVDFPNLPNARNIGIKNSVGDIIIFFDDDIEINEKTIPSHITAFSDIKIGCVTGKVNIINTDTENNIVLQNKRNIHNLIKRLIFFFFKNKASYTSFFGIISNFSGNKALSCDTCIGCNMSFKREVFTKCGYFDTNYTGNAYREDTDMSVRLKHSGYKLIYNPLASINHFIDNRGGTRTSSNKNYWYTIFKNQCYFYLKNFNYSYLHILILHIFDFIRCNKLKLNTYSIFKNGYRDALTLKNQI